MDSKNTNLKEKLKQALTSTARAISDDYKIEGDVEQNKSCLLYTSPSPRD